MKISVDLPQPIGVNGMDSVQILTGPGMDRVTVFGNGTITIKQNGGEFPLLITLNIKELFEQSKGITVTRPGKPTIISD